MNGLKPIEDEAEIELICNTDYVAPMAGPFCKEVGKNSIYIPGVYIESINNVNDIKIRDEDVFVMGYPKTGTTWCQEMIWLLVNDLDYERAKEDILLRFPLLEYPSALAHDLSFEWINGAPKYFEELQSPRLIKTHLPWFLLPEQIRNGSKKPKIIYCLRNPKDCCVSYYYYLKSLGVFLGPFENFCKLVLAGREPYGPFWTTVLSFWQQRHSSNILFVEYTEMKESLPAVIKKIAHFLGRSIKDKDVDQLVDHLSFDSMKVNPAVNHKSIKDFCNDNSEADVDQEDENAAFIRRGIVGDHKSKMTPEMIEKFNAWIEKNLEDTDFSYKSLSQ